MMLVSLTGGYKNQLIGHLQGPLPGRSCPACENTADTPQISPAFASIAVQTMLRVDCGCFRAPSEHTYYMFSIAWDTMGTMSDITSHSLDWHNTPLIARSQLTACPQGCDKSHASRYVSNFL